jgi:hypothetical protein
LVRTKTVLNGIPINKRLEITFSVDFSKISGTSKFYPFVDSNFLNQQQMFLGNELKIDQGPALPLVGVKTGPWL